MENAWSIQRGTITEFHFAISSESGPVAIGRSDILNLRFTAANTTTAAGLEGLEPWPELGLAKVPVRPGVA